MARATLSPLPLALLVAAFATAPAPGQSPALPDPARLKADVTAMVGFGTRHSLSATDDPRRGIGAARRWAAASARPAAPA